MTLLYCPYSSWNLYYIIYSFRLLYRGTSISFPEYILHIQQIDCILSLFVLKVIHIFHASTKYKYFFHYKMESSRFLTVATIIATASLVFHFVGLSTPYWYQLESYENRDTNDPSFKRGRITHFGLWHYCSKDVEEKCTEDYCYSLSGTYIFVVFVKSCSGFVQSHNCGEFKPINKNPLDFFHQRGS
jgi:hypothetical protein